MTIKFHKYFRLPFPQYTNLLGWVRVDPLFDRWCGKKKTKSSPVELLLLGALRSIKIGWTFDNIEEATAINEEVHQVFLHAFITFACTFLFNQFISTPVGLVEAQSNIHKYEKAGFPGCVRSIDCTLIITE
jgi:hypothetical protein